MAEIPAYPLISCGTFPSRRGKNHESHSLILPDGYIPKSFSDLAKHQDNDELPSISGIFVLLIKEQVVQRFHANSTMLISPGAKIFFSVQ